MTTGASRSRGFLATLVAAVAILVAGLAAASQLTLGFRAWTTEDARRIAVAERPVDLSALPVVTPAGSEDDLWISAPATKAWLVTFIYTRCPTICVSLGSEFQQLQAALDSAPGVRLASLSFDRPRDTPATLGDYARRFGADPRRWVVAAPSSDDASRRMLAETGVVVIPDGMGGYAHNAAIHVIVPPGKLVRVFGMGQHREALAFAAGLAQ